MRLRLALLLLLFAAAVHWGFTRPVRAQLFGAADEQRRLRDERRDLAARLLPLERAEAARARALRALEVAPLPAGNEVQVLRRTVLQTLAAERLADVRVAVRPGRGEWAASVSLGCGGSLDAVVRAADELVRPGSGLVLSQVRLNATATGIALELDAGGIRQRP